LRKRLRSPLGAVSRAFEEGLKMRQRFAVGLAIGLAGLLLPMGAGAQEPQPGGEINISQFEDADTLDPTFAGTAGSREIFINMCEKLYDIDLEGALVPQLATAMPEISEDGLTMTIPVREGVLFNDGTPFDAAAVAKSLDRHINAEGSRRAGELSSIAAIEAPDATTVVLTLKAPDSSLTAQLSDRAGMIMSPAQLDALGEDFGNDPVCVGPFEFSERVVGDHTTLERSEHYYDKDHVYLDRITYRLVTDETVRTANLRSGDLQIVDRVGTTDVEGLRSDPAVKVLDKVSNAYTMMTFNIANASGIGEPPGEVDSPLVDPALREAFELAIDRDQINQIVYSGLQVPGCGPISPASPYSDGSTCPPRDLARAQELVAASGVATPIPVELKMPSTPVNIRLGELLQSQVAEAGFDLSVVPEENTTAFDDQTNGAFQIMLGRWSGRVDPDANIHRFNHTDGGDNYSKASDLEVDALLQQGREEYDTEARKAIYGELVDLLKERRNAIYLQHEVLYSAADAAVQGYDLYVDGMPRLKSAYLAQG
jgi:peptide/nickel transport system substrate-binding protein